MWCGPTPAASAPLPNLLEGAKVAREFGADCTIGIGGGSCMDAAKVISVLANNDPDYVLPNFYKFLSFQEDYANPLLKTICIPTTAGTGSESTFVGCYQQRRYRHQGWSAFSSRLRHHRPRTGRWFSRTYDRMVRLGRLRTCCRVPVQHQ